MSARSLAELRQRRDAILHEIAGIGDLRPGSLFSRFRGCGKPNCHCAREGDPGHGPSWFLQRQDGKRLRQRSIPARALDETRQQLAECGRLRRLTRELIGVSEDICHLKLRSDRRSEAVEATKKGGSASSSRPRSPPKPSA